MDGSRSLEIIHHAINSVIMVQIPLKKYLDTFKKDLFFEFYFYDGYGSTNPYEALKTYYGRLPITPRMIEVYLHCGNQYIAIVQKSSEDYGSAIILGYYSIMTVRLENGTWSKKDI